MGSFFSGTDWEQLEDRGVLSNYFLMLIVDFKGEYKAKVAFKADIESEKESVIKLSNNSDSFPDIPLIRGANRVVLAVMDCNVVYQEVPVDDEFKKRYEAVKEECSKPAFGNTWYGKSTGWSEKGGYANSYGNLNTEDPEAEWDWKNSRWKEKEKTEKIKETIKRKTPKIFFPESAKIEKKEEEAKISEMTSKQWQEYCQREGYLEEEEGVEDFEWQGPYSKNVILNMKDARKLLNMIFFGETFSGKSPIEAILSISKTLTPTERETFIQEFPDKFEEAYITLYDIEEQYDHCIELVKKELELIKKTELGKGMLAKLETLKVGTV